MFRAHAVADIYFLYKFNPFPNLAINFLRISVSCLMKKSQIVKKKKKKKKWMANKRNLSTFYSIMVADSLP